MTETTAAIEPRSPAIEERDWPHEWMGAFLRGLATLPNVSAAARNARISRKHVYRVAESDPAFREAWDEAWQVGLDLAEQLAYRRGSTGEEVTITRTQEKRNAEGQIIETVTVTETKNRVSDGLMLAWLRAHRPGKWGERVDHRHGGNPDGPPIQHELGPRVRTPERLAALVGIAAEQRERQLLEATVGEDGVAHVDEPGNA